MDELPVAANALRDDEYTRMVRCIIDPPNDGIWDRESPIRRLFAVSIDSGADELGPARNVIAQLLEFAVAYDARPKRERPWTTE